MRSGTFAPRELRIVRVCPSVLEPLAMGTRVMLNSGGPAGLIVDFLGGKLLAVAWPDGLEAVLPRACLTAITIQGPT
jgi:hypothetical protein